MKLTENDSKETLPLPGQSAAALAEDFALMSERNRTHLEHVGQERPDDYLVRRPKPFRRSRHLLDGLVIDGGRSKIVAGNQMGTDATRLF